MLAGVCGGLARYFGIHPAFYRVGFVVLTLIGGAGILIYAAAALVIPDEGNEDSVAARILKERRDRPWPLIGLGLIAVAGAVLLSRATLWPRGDAAWILLLLAGVVIGWLTRHRSPEPTASAPGSGAGEAEAVTTVAAPVAEATPRSRSRPGRTILAWVGALVLVMLTAAAIFAAVFSVHLGRGVGERTYAPVALQDLNRTYRLGVGSMRLDLTNFRLPVGETHVLARVDVGDLRIVVPRGTAVQVKGDVQLGYLNLLGVTHDGRNVDWRIDERGARVLVLDAHVGAGSLRVTRAVR